MAARRDIVSKRTTLTVERELFEDFFVIDSGARMGFTCTTLDLAVRTRKRRSHPNRSALVALGA